MILKNKKIIKGTIGPPQFLAFGLALVAFIVILATVVPGIKGGVENVLNIIRGGLGIGPGSNELTAAIECAYYRCTNGCITAENKAGDDFGCSAFCSSVPSEFKKDGKICGWNAMQYPVELDGFYQDIEFSKRIGDINFECVIPSDSSHYGVDAFEVANGLVIPGSYGICMAAIGLLGWTGVAPTLACGASVIALTYNWVAGETYYNGIAIDAGIIESRETTSCDIPGMVPATINDALSAFRINTNKKLSIYSDHYKGLIFEQKLTVVSSVPTYVTVLQGKERQIQLAKNILHRVHVEDIGDIFVKPITEWPTGGNGDEYDDEITGETYSHLEVICSSGGVPEQGLDKDMCDYGPYSFCEGNIHVKCLDVDNSEELWFSMSSSGMIDGIYLYRDLNFGGTSIIVETVNDLLNNNFDNVASSVIILGDYENATLYRDKDYDGDYMTLRGGYDAQYLGYHYNLAFSNKASSVKFIGPADCQATLYNWNNYNTAGGSKVIDADISDLRDLDGPCWWSNWNNCASSIKIKEGCSLTLYQDVDYGGERITIAGDSSVLYIDNRVSSIKLN